MKLKAIVFICLIHMGAAASIWATPGDSAKAKVEADQPAAPKFSDEQTACVSGWMKNLAPAAPSGAVAAATQKFLEELHWQHPEKLDRIAAGADEKEFESALLRNLGAQLTSPAQAGLREDLAHRRVQALLGESARPDDVRKVAEQLKKNSPVSYQRLLEGRIEDDDLAIVIKETGRSGATEASTKAKPKELTAAEIIAEFSRHNQSGAALQHLRACIIDGSLKTSDGKEKDLVMFKLRPDRFRLHVLFGDSTVYMLISDGSGFWQQSPGSKLQAVAQEKLGNLRYLCEFMNPLFGEQEGYTFERLEDGKSGDQKLYRIAVHRPDGSHYIAYIDPQSWHETEEEHDGSVSVHYSDFRTVSGLTVAFCEETIDGKGRKETFHVAHFIGNPGLVAEFFQPQEGPDLNYFAVERLTAGLPVQHHP